MVDELVKLYLAKDIKIVETIIRYNSSQDDHGINPWYILNLMRDGVSIDVAKGFFSSTNVNGPLTIFED
jgi:hypothetical protein